MFYLLIFQGKGTLVPDEHVQCAIIIIKTPLYNPRLQVLTFYTFRKMETEAVSK